MPAHATNCRPVIAKGETTKHLRLWRSSSAKISALVAAARVMQGGRIDEHLVKNKKQKFEKV
jgi:hypothetical protein